MGKKDEKQGQQKAAKKKGSYAVYKETGREDRNKRRNVATEERRQAKDATKRPRREALRKIGAVNRLERRLRSEKERPPTAMAIAFGKAREAAQKAVEKARG